MTHREQIEAIKLQLNISTDIELARILNTSKNNVYSYAIRGIPTKKILQLQRMGITICGSDASNVVESKQPPPEISPHAVADCEKISGELETVKGMVEFYRSELEQVRGELNRTKDELIFALKEIARLTRELNTGVDARQQSGRSAVERGNTTNASEIQKVMA